MTDKVIKIKCRVCNTLDVYKYKIDVYNYCNTLLESGNTDEYGIYYLNVKENTIYKIIITNYNLMSSKRCLILLVKNNYPDEIQIVFSSLSNNNHPIIVRLTDYNYPNLPIMEGEIVLWKMNKE